MARNKTLLSLLQDYRAATGASRNTAHNLSARDAQVYALADTQAWLWSRHSWPHLRVQRFLDLQAGQRFYNPAAADNEQGVAKTDLTTERLETIDVRYGRDWCGLQPGIGPEQYATFDSGLDERSWPVERWQVYEGDVVEIWPVPAEDTDPVSLEGRLRLSGIRALKPLVLDTDTADLDDALIVKYAAARALAAQGSKDAQLMLEQAKDQEARITGAFAKRQSFVLFGEAPKTRRPQGPPRIHYRLTDG